MEQKHQHLNIPQMRSGLIMAPEEWAVWARGTGKTTGVLAPKSATYLNMMPRCTGVFVAATFQQLLTRTLKPLVAGWERMGYKRGVHFLVGEKPTKKWKEMWNWEGPYQPPFDYSHFICWWNGAGIQMISQDRVGSSNGVSIDFIMGDEAKLLNEARLKEELFPANRGIYKELANNPHHHGKTFTTDMPVGTAGRWILDKREQMDLNKLYSIWTLLEKIDKINKQISETNNKTIQSQLAKKIASGEQLLNILRRNFVYYHEASALDNVDALGIDYFKEELRSLSKFQFSTAILNIRPYKMEDGFYPTLNEEKHGYFSYKYDHFNKVGYDFELLSEYDDCRKDGDLIKNEPLHLAVDYNKSVWPFVTGQVTFNEEKGCKELRVLSGLHVKFPLSLSEALDTWTKYYKFHTDKQVYFWFDTTALGETRKSNRTDIVEGLEERGWTVHEMYINQALNHEVKYNFLYNLLAENNTYDWCVRMNRDNCKYLLLSMFQAQSRISNKGVKKDKRPEHDPKFPQEEATHYSDAFDTLAIGTILSGKDYGSIVNTFSGIIIN